MNSVILYRIDETKHMYRYYSWDVQPDLFGQWCLMREWGRMGQAGHTREAVFPTFTEVRMPSTGISEPKKGEDTRNGK